MKRIIICVFRVLFLNPMSTESAFDYKDGVIWIDCSPRGEMKLYKVYASQYQIRLWLRNQDLIVYNTFPNEEIKRYANAHKQKWIKVL